MSHFAAQASKDFLNVGSLRVTAPLLCAMYLAPLCHFMKGFAPAFVPFVAGSTGTHKTTVCALALSHFGNFNQKQPPASFSDTANSIRRKAFLVKDAPLLVDDFHPNTDLKNKQRMCETAQQLARAWGDLAERGRMQSDLTVRQSEPPRGMGLMCGEDVPDIGESGLARFYVIDIHASDIRVNAALSQLQEQARRGKLAVAMRGYIETLGQEAPMLSQKLRKLFETNRAEVTSLLQGAHGRTNEAVAWLLIGMQKMLEYWQMVGLDVNGLHEEITHALLENAQEQQRGCNGEKPVELFFNAIRELLYSQQAHIAGHNVSLGTLIGYKQDGNVYLLPQVAYGVVAKLFQGQGSTFPIGRGQLWKRMDEQGLLVTRGKDLTPTKRIGEQSQRVLCIAADAVFGGNAQEAFGR